MKFTLLVLLMAFVTFKGLSGQEANPQEKWDREIQRLIDQHNRQVEKTRRELELLIEKMNDQEDRGAITAASEIAKNLSPLRIFQPVAVEISLPTYSIGTDRTRFSGSGIQLEIDLIIRNPGVSVLEEQEMTIRRFRDGRPLPDKEVKRVFPITGGIRPKEQIVWQIAIPDSEIGHPMLRSTERIEISSDGSTWHKAVYQNKPDPAMNSFLGNAPFVTKQQEWLQFRNDAQKKPSKKGKR
jgi:uncharacterized coiled-coil protein SlyX